MKNKSSGLYNIIDKEGINKSINNVIATNVDFNGYGSPKGIKELRIKIGEFIKDCWNYNINYQDILITTGSQQSLNLVAYSLLKEGDTIFIEQPTYYGAINVFKNRKVKMVGINLGPKGLDLITMEEKILKYRPKLIYVVPTFNNPTGYSWTMDYRKKFLDIINKYNIMVLEDDPYSLINFTSIKYKSLYEMNNGKNVIYLGTFSKYISPSINVGYIITDECMMSNIYSYKEAFDLSTSLFIQFVVLDYLKNNDLKKIVVDRIRVYKKLLHDNINELKDKYAKDLISYSDSKGGLFIHVQFKCKVNWDTFDNGNNYYIDGNHDNETRVNICNLIENL